MVALFGRANWWMPAGLARILRVRGQRLAAGPAAGAAAVGELEAAPVLSGSR